MMSWWPRHLFFKFQISHAHFFWTTFPCCKELLLFISVFWIDDCGPIGNILILYLGSKNDRCTLGSFAIIRYSFCLEIWGGQRLSRGIRPGSVQGNLQHCLLEICLAASGMFNRLIELETPSGVFCAFLTHSLIIISSFGLGVCLPLQYTASWKFGVETISTD